jgi:cation transport ATPase
VSIGAHGYIKTRVPSLVDPALDGSPGEPSLLRAYVSIDGNLAGGIEFTDQIRPNARRLLTSLGALGISRSLLLSGDRASNVRSVADAVGIETTRPP